MRKSVIIAIVLALVVGSMVAAVPFEFEATSQPFALHSLRSVSMGGAGLATPGRSDGLFINPASLGQKRFFLSIPSVAVTLYNFKHIMDEDIFTELKTAIDSGDEMELVTPLTDYLNGFGYGRNEMLSVDASVSFNLGSLAFGIAAQERMHTTNTTSGSASGVNLIGEVNAAAVTGYGLRLHFSDSVSLDLGASAKFAYRAYSEEIPLLDTATEILQDDQTFMETTPVMAGYAVPFDVGATLNLPLGFSLGAVARNLNGNYRMVVYPSINNFMDTASSELGELLNPSGTTVTMVTPWSLDAGISWAPDLGNVFKPTIAVDVVDIMGLTQDDGKDVKTKLLERLNIGTEARLVNTFDLRFGINQGYMSVGAGLDLYVLRIDAAYYWREFGQSIGEKPVDALSIRVNLGFDR